MKNIQSGKARFYEIDLFRFLAALSVVFYHYTFRGHAADNFSLLSFPSLAIFFKYGYLGVNLFFMISGFVILLTALNRDLPGFVISRITRLYPAFWISVTLTAFVALILGGERFHVAWFQYLANMTMLSGYFGITHVDGVYWTLLVELKFYFLIGIILLFRQIHNIHYYLYAWLGVSLVNLIVDLPYSIQMIFLTKWSSYFIAGCFFYLIRKQGVNLAYIGAILITYYQSIHQAVSTLPVMQSHYQVIFSSQVIVLLITLFYILMFTVAIEKTRLINKKIMMKLGMLTYPLYLIHQNVGYMIFNRFGQNMNKYFVLGGVVMLMLLAAFLISNRLERWMAQKLKAFCLHLDGSIKKRLYKSVLK